MNELCQLAMKPRVANGSAFSAHGPCPAAGRTKR